MNPATILIVDDDLMLGEQLRSLLAALGHKPTLCSDASKALALIEEIPFDLLFCDYWMPSPGQSFYQLVISRRPEIGPKIIFVTGGVLGSETQFFIRSTGNLQLMKPFKLPALQQVLCLALETEEAVT